MADDPAVTLREAVIAWLQVVPELDDSAATLRESVVSWLQVAPVADPRGGRLQMTSSGLTGGALYQSAGGSVPTLREAMVAFLRSL